MDDAVRIYNITVSVLIAVIGAPQLRSFLTRGGKDQLHWQSSIVLNVTLFWGSIESLRGGYPGGARVYLGAIGLTWLLITVAYKPIARLRAWRSHTPKETP